MSRRSAALPASLASALLTGWATLTVEGAAFTNGGFELGAFEVADADHVMSLPVGSTLVNGWTTIGAELAWARNDNPYVGPAATDGTLFLDLTGFHDAPPYGGITQTFDTTPGQALSLGFDLISLEGSTFYRGPVSVTATADGVSQTFSFASILPFAGIQSQRFSMPFTASGTSSTISLQGTLATGGQFLGLDNVTVPEPGTAALLIVGGATLAGLRRRRASGPQ